jgi:hypothetical protein
VVHALERLQGLGDDKAGQYLASITRFVFVIALVVSEHILQSTVFLSKFLQGIECDLLEATKECKTVIVHIFDVTHTNDTAVTSFE